MSYLDKLKARIAENVPHEEPPKPPEPSFGGYGGEPECRISEKAQRERQREWRVQLAGLDPWRPVAGIEGQRWRNLCEDAFWIFEKFGEPAARDNWSGLDLFGVLPVKPYWGGLADRLRGARNLKLVDGRARWAHMGVPEQWNRGSGLALVSSGLLLMWELPHAE